MSIFRKRTKKIPARKAQVGQRLVAIHYKHDGSVERMAGRFGRYPTITDATYREDGERGQPTVYLAADDDSDGVWCLCPDEMVEVIA